MRSLLVVAILLLAGCIQMDPSSDADRARESDQQEREPESAATGQVLRSGHDLEGTQAPSYAPPGLQGDAPSLDALRGNVTLVFVWASWCSNCKADEPLLEEIHDDYAEQGFRIMAVSHESSKDAAVGHAEREGWTFGTYYDRDVNPHFGLRNYQPNHLLVDRDGTIQWVRESSLRNDDSTLRHNIEALL